MPPPHNTAPIPKRIVPESSKAGWWDGLRKISEAMDGRSEALRDELVAFFRRPSHQSANTELTGCQKTAISKTRLLVILPAKLHNRLYERPSMLRIHIRRNPMPQVEDMPGT